MICGDLDLERAARDPAYLRTIKERAGLDRPAAEPPAEAPLLQQDTKAEKTSYAR